MAYKDLHAKPFDESTIAKLEIFEDYAEAWIPTFLMTGYKEIYIYDFFAGTGYDKNGVKGSPIRLLQKIKNYETLILQKKTRIHIIFNEFEPARSSQKKFELLQESCDQFIADNNLNDLCNVSYENEDFEKLFPKFKYSISKNPSLVYLDQNGIKFLGSKYLLALEKMNTTDFLFFSSSSYIKRFGDRDEFKKHINISLEELNKAPYTDIHRVVIKELKKVLPKGTDLKLYPFTIKKGSNIYGIIFGSKHPRAVDKFLKIVWKKNTANGEANFDIDNEAINSQIDIFGNVKVSKIDKFKNDVKEKILSSEIVNNFELLDYTFKQGHIGEHSAEVLRELKRKKKIYYDGTSPCVSYDKVYKRNSSKLVVYKVIKNEKV